MVPYSQPPYTETSSRSIMKTLAEIKQFLSIQLKKALEKWYMLFELLLKTEDMMDTFYIDQRLLHIIYYKRCAYINEIIEYYEIGEALQRMEKRHQGFPLAPFLKREDRTIAQRVYALFYLHPTAIYHFEEFSPNNLVRLNDSDWKEVYFEAIMFNDFWCYSDTQETKYTE